MVNRLSSSSVHNFIVTLAAYLIPASLKFITNNLQAMTEATGPSQQPADSSPKAPCLWSDAETSTLINYLYDHQEKLSGGGFKDAIWTGLGLALKDKHHVTRSHSAMKTKFSELKGVVNSIDEFNSKSGRSSLGGTGSLILDKGKVIEKLM
ncbi:hypothetical protein L208DRAFT_1377011 [Tricholoma matsutake]|nr:hypothetical protein L208DRAFT_1377011 [Tricholoma matsutake 945]